MLPTTHAFSRVTFALIVLACSANAQSTQPCQESGATQVSLSTAVYDRPGLMGDGQGSYVDGLKNVFAYVNEAASLWTTYPGRDLLRRPRSLRFRLQPLDPANPAFDINDPRGEVHIFNRLEPLPPGSAYAYRIHSIQELQFGQPSIRAERSEFELAVGGVPHMITMGPWAKNTCNPTAGAPVGGGTDSSLAIVEAQGTKDRKGAVTTTGWRAYCAGCVARLYNVADVWNPVLVGLYYFDFDVVFAKR